LQRNIGYSVLNKDLAIRNGRFHFIVRLFLALILLGALPFRPAISFSTEQSVRDFVAPIPEAALGKLHDVSLMHEGYRFPFVGNSIANCGGDQTTRSQTTYRFYADSNLDAGRRELRITFQETFCRLQGAEAYFRELFGKFLLKYFQKAFRLRS